MDDLVKLKSNLKRISLETLCAATFVFTNISCVSELFGNNDTEPLIPIPTGINITGWDRNEFSAKKSRL